MRDEIKRLEGLVADEEARLENARKDSVLLEELLRAHRKELAKVKLDQNLQMKDLVKVQLAKRFGLEGHEKLDMLFAIVWHSGREIAITPDQINQIVYNKFAELAPLIGGKEQI